MKELDFQIQLGETVLGRFFRRLEKNSFRIVIGLLVIVSISSFIHYYLNGLGLAYNDARSHLNIGRRVVEGLKPGLAQLGSVWLPLTHLLMVPTIWNDFMWHSGLAGAILSMTGFVATGGLIYRFLEHLGADLLSRLVGVSVFVLNINVLYLQSTAMTELLLIATMTAGAYELLNWFQSEKVYNLVKAAFWIMLSTLVRYDGWFLLVFSLFLIIGFSLHQRGYRYSEGTTVLFLTLGGFGIGLWVIWNLLIFGDPFYFIFGPYSAYSQQQQLEAAGQLITKSNWWLSLKFYFYAMAYNSNMFALVLAIWGAVTLWFDRAVRPRVRLASVALIAPFFFNIIALYLGHSVLFIQGLSGDTWFNIRYGIMLMPAVAIFIGYLVHYAQAFRAVIIGLLLFVVFFQFTSGDAVTIDDAKFGSSQKNVSEVSGWLAEHAARREGFILVSAASHDAIIFSSGLPMSRFIHEGTGDYWQSATTNADHWARWIVMRTYSDTDSTWQLVSKTPALERYAKIESFPFADIYELKPEYLGGLKREISQNQ